jgi:hypothetical protein
VFLVGKLLGLASQAGEGLERVILTVSEVTVSFSHLPSYSLQVSSALFVCRQHISATALLYTYAANSAWISGLEEVSL